MTTLNKFYVSYNRIASVESVKSLINRIVGLVIKSVSQRCESDKVNQRKVSNLICPGLNSCVKLNLSNII